MNRSGPPKRKTELARGEGPKASVEASRAWQQRSRDRARDTAREAPARKPLAARSAATTDRADERAAVIAAVWHHQHGRCALWWHPTPCGGPLDVHEVIRRNHYPDGPYDARVCLGLCRTHHKLDTFKDEAELLGLRVPSGIWDQHRYTAVDEQTRRRASWASGIDPGPPSWWPNHDFSTTI